MEFLRGDCWGRPKTQVVLIVTLFLVIGYDSRAATDKPLVALSSSEIFNINKLSVDSRAIPPWLIAQLLHLSDDLEEALRQSGQSLPLIELNELLAEPMRYQGRVVALKTLFVNSQNVKEPLQLAPDEDCWSVLLLDVKYHKVLQVFTSQNPQKFRKNQVLYVVGVFLTTRKDEPQTGETAQPLTVPVVIGTLLPVESPTPSPGTTNFFPFLAVIIFLTLLYVLVRIYVARTLKR